MNRGRGNPPAENLQGDQRLQQITLSKVPIPDKNIDCQSLLRQSVSHKGWLRRKKPGKLIDALGLLAPSVMWEQMYVVICKGCLYFYNNESDKKPQKAISLFGYTRVMRASELKMKQAAGLWPFKVAYVLDEHDRVHYLNAPCEDDMMKWLKFIKLELYIANGIEYSEEVDEDIHDLETPISTGNYFSRIQDLSQIKEVVEDDSDMDSDYDYIETDDAVAKSQFSETSSNSSHNAQSQASHRNPVALPPPKSGKALPQLPAKPQNKAPAQSQGYYPSSILNQPKPSGGGKPPPATPAKKLPSTPSSKPQPMQPPVMAKQKLPKGSGGGGGTRDSPPKTPSGESISFVSVNDLKKAIADIHVTSPSGKGPPYGKGPLTGKASAQATRSPDHLPLGETKSSSVATFKPLPPIPGQTRGSNAPTAVVMPIRQSAAAQNRSTQDLERAALWEYDAGEGQRLLMSLGREGAYMLRYCADGTGAFTLLAIADFQLRKYKIFRNEDGMFSLQTDFRPCFDSVHNLLNYYRTNNLPNRQTTLSQCYSELQQRR